MRALPARPIALGALCAALLVGTTGSVAMAADSFRERPPVASSDTLLAQVRTLHAHEGDLAPVVDLLEAVLAADGGHLPPAEAKRLGEAAEKALEEAVAKARETAPAPAAPAPATTPEASDPAATSTATPEAPDASEASDPADDTLLADDTAEGMSDLLDMVREAIGNLTDLLLSDDETDDASAPASLGGLLTEVKDLVDALLDPSAPQASTLPAPASATQVPLLAGLKLPVLPPLLTAP
ncbi:hypothetical protein ACIRFH_01105 [Streptomyces sp. NPDC093586]|uniref:hypothetical protein n=1 Tax=Streptomyces sp. NPDC093586 TaxID=3366042 RepID=UPI0037F6C5A1